MVIALNVVTDQGFWLRLGALIIVTIQSPSLVYGVVALIVKMDDVGLALVRRKRYGGSAHWTQHGLAVPVVMVVPVVCRHRRHALGGQSHRPQQDPRARLGSAL